MSWKHYQTVDPPPPKIEPQVGKGLFGVHLLIPSPQISIFQIRQIFNISYFPQFINLSLQKEYLFPKMLKNYPKIYTKPPNSG